MTDMIEQRKNYSAYIEAPELSEKYIDADTYEIERALEHIYYDPSEDWDMQDNYNRQEAFLTRWLKIKKLKEAIIHERRPDSDGYYYDRYWLHEDFIDMFCKVMGFKRKWMPNKDYQIADYRGTPIWKTEKKLLDYIRTDSWDFDKALRPTLKKFAAKCPAAVKADGDNKSLMFNLLYLADFCDFAKCSPIPVPIKTDEWKTADELKAEYIDGVGVKKIAAAMEVFATREYVEPPVEEDFDIEEEFFDRTLEPEYYAPLSKSFNMGSCVVLMNPDTDKPELCLNVKNIGKFIEFLNADHKKKIDAATLKHGIKAVKTLDDLKRFKTPKSDGWSM
ncbi:MAG: hypothetical protein J5714_00565 [Alphaproteobacteria bacterium]|nr:hypothetical protein [Alphaproteobacteria bacterium]